MNNDDLDKTKIKIPGKDSGGSKDDATRIVNNDAKRNIPGTSSSDAETLVNEQRSDEADVVNDETASDNKTIFNPKPIIPQDKTRIKQAAVRSEQHEGLEDLSSRIYVGSDSQDILKGRFVLEDVLGAGGMGVVYKAKDLLKVEAKDRDPYVAIKVLSDEFKSHPEAFISLQRESRKSQRIAHPNIVNVHDFDRDDDTVFMTMEYMEGEPLDKLIRKYKSTGLPTDDAWLVIQGMSSALLHAHAENIVHSDFKPGNVFVTNKGIAKVFDFGISRAVAIAEKGADNPDDKTVFDAGTLGALTPAYASLEMLQGQKPDFRDDIYALGCVAYEMLTGSHPYNRVPADEAEKRGLKPARIQNIKKYQWKAIEKAIALRREDRTESVEKFIDDVSPKLKSPSRLIPIVAILISTVVAVYLIFIQESKPDPYSEFDIRNELELKVRIDFYKENLEALLASPSFTKPWQDDVWKHVSDLYKLTAGGSDWLTEKKGYIYDLYLSKIDESIEGRKYKFAQSLIEPAKRYTEEHDALDDRAQKIASLYERMKRASAQVEKKKVSRAPEVNVQEDANKTATTKKKTVELFDLALSNLNEQLRCTGRLNMSNIATAVNKLRDLDSSRYKTHEKRIVTSLGACIQQVGKAFPARAEEAKKLSLRLFDGNAYLASIKIQPRDPCDVSLAGLGARGKRATCNDTVASKKSGPELVVIPANSSFKPFAIGKYEISIKDINLFCKASGQCSGMSSENSSMPASDLSLETINKYLRWLSKESGQRYRLPTRSEWLYAVTSRRKKLDPNRNCKLSARGIQKGEGLVEADMGAQNGWGVVNYVGNVQEIVYGKGRKLVAVGGSYKESMDKCDINTVNAHSGKPDPYTGFRVLREIRSSS